MQFVFYIIILNFILIVAKEYDLSDFSHGEGVLGVERDIKGDVTDDSL